MDDEEREAMLTGHIKALQNLMRQILELADGYDEESADATLTAVGELAAKGLAL